MTDDQLPTMADHLTKAYTWYAEDLDDADRARATGIASVEERVAALVRSYGSHANLAEYLRIVLEHAQTERVRAAVQSALDGLGADGINQHPFLVRKLPD